MRFKNSIMKLNEFGLINKWQQDRFPVIRQCRNARNSNKLKIQLANGFEPLSLERLTGAFSVLLVGFATSFLVWLSQKIHFSYQQ